MSQRELAEKTGIRECNISRLESDELDNPPLRYLVNRAYALGLPDYTDVLEDGWLQPHR